MRGLALPFFGVLMSFKKEDLLVNIKRQAKRLSKLLTIPLGQAQEGQLFVYMAVTVTAIY